MRVCLLVLYFPLSVCIWPPPYKIHLNHSEEFAIFEDFGGKDDDIYSDEDEMIKENDVGKYHLNRDTDKYYKIHKFAMRMWARNPTNATHPKQSIVTHIKWKERSFDKEDDVPFIAGFFENNKSNLLRENSNVFYLNEMAKSMVDSKVNEQGDIIVRRRKSDSEEKEYDYRQLKKDYDDEVRRLKAKTETLNFVNVKEEESVKDAARKMVDFKMPKNCTAEEMKGIGLGAVECFVADLKHGPKDKRMLLYGIRKLILIWFAIYLLIACLCWCQKGWCCCCFRCRFCKPRKRIDEAKRFLAENPPGVYRTPEGIVLKYKPTPYEKYTQKRLEQAVMKL